MQIPYQIILASKSPRRSQLLREMDIPFKIKTKEVDESFPADLPTKDVAAYISQKKAEAFRDELEDNQLVITADTVVVHNDKILGKPKDRDEALQFLRDMSDDHHLVYTGVTLMTKDKVHSFTDVSEVHLSPISDNELAHYLDQYQPYDKAGAYGIQEWFGHNFITAIKGTYTNIMGLPTSKLYQALKEFC